MFSGVGIDGVGARDEVFGHWDVDLHSFGIKIGNIIAVFSFGRYSVGCDVAGKEGDENCCEEKHFKEWMIGRFDADKTSIGR